jgi:hypothetical protein
VLLHLEEGLAVGGDHLRKNTPCAEDCKR